ARLGFAGGSAHGPRGASPAAAAARRLATAIDCLTGLSFYDDDLGATAFRSPAAPAARFVVVVRAGHVGRAGSAAPRMVIEPGRNVKCLPRRVRRPDRGGAPSAAAPLLADGDRQPVRIDVLRDPGAKHGRPLRNAGDALRDHP